MNQAGGIPYQRQVAKPHMNTQELIDLCKKVCDMYATGRYTVEKACAKVGIRNSTFLKAACPTQDLTRLLMDDKPLPPRAIPVVHDMYMEAKAKCTKNYTELLVMEARDALRKKVSGGEYEEVTEDYEIDKKMFNEDGSPNPNFGKPFLVKKRVKRIVTQPDTTAIIFALTNVDKDNFQEKKHIDMTTKEEGLERKDLSELQRKEREIERRLEKARSIAEDIDFEDVKEE